MAELALTQLKEVLDVYASRSVERLAFMRDRDDQIDAMYTSLFRELLTYMMEDPRNITACTHLLFCAKNIERIGDHATNIAETIFYVRPASRCRRIARRKTRPTRRPQRLDRCRLSWTVLAGTAGNGLLIGTVYAEKPMDLPSNFNAEAPADGGGRCVERLSAGRSVADIDIEEAGKWSRKEGHVVWIGLLEPSRELLLRVQRQFDLHDLAIEDAEHPHQRPKLEQYGNAMFIVARTAQLIQGRVTFGETHLFVGAGYLVSVRHGPSTSYTAVRQHWESCPSALAKGEDFILYAILDFIVDNYMPVLETIEDEVDEIEDRVLVRPMTSSDIERLYMLRRDLLRLRNAAGPLVEVCRRLTGAELPQIRPAMHTLFRDVTDHIRTVQEKIDNLREVLAFAFEASLLVGQSQETAIAKKLAAWAAILAVPTAVAGIYGMNFHDMPELNMKFGYESVLFGMFAACLFLYWRFRSNGWL